MRTKPVCVLPAAAAAAARLSLSLVGEDEDLVRATCECVSPHNRTVVRLGSPKRWKQERS